MGIISFEELLKGVKDKKIRAVDLKSGSKCRLFISTTNELCYFDGGSRKRGFGFPESGVKGITKVIYNTVKDPDKAQYNLISKYRKYALKASFTNDFIRDCLALPETFEQWVADGKKSLYNYNVTTGNGIDGVVITVDRIAKKYPYIAQRIREAITSKDGSMRSSRVPFAGYEMTVTTSVHDGDFMMHLSLEFKDTGNGYYYLLINDDNFIGYDID